MSSARQLQTGGTYQLPPPASGIEPAMQEAFSTWKDNVTQTAQLIQQKQGRAVTVADGLVRAYQVSCCQRQKCQSTLSISCPSHMLYMMSWCGLQAEGALSRSALSLCLCVCRCCQSPCVSPTKHTSLTANISIDMSRGVLKVVFVHVCACTQGSPSVCTPDMEHIC